MQPKIVVIGSANIEKRALSYALIVQAERTGFEDSPLMGAWGCNEKRAFTARFSLKMAGRAGFEPAAEFNPSTHLAGEPNRPLWHLPRC